MAVATSIVVRGLLSPTINEKIVLIDVLNLAATADTIELSTVINPPATAGVVGVGEFISAICFNSTTGVQKGATITSTAVSLTATNTGTLTAWLWCDNVLA